MGVTWPQLSLVREHKLGDDRYDGILDDPEQRRMLPLQAHSSVVALRLCLPQGHPETACLQQTCHCFGDPGKALILQRGDCWSSSTCPFLWTSVPRILHCFGQVSDILDGVRKSRQMWE